MIGISLVNRKNFLVGSLSLVIIWFIANDWSVIALSGGVVGNGWLRTNFCGRSGVIHQSQILFRR